MKLNKQSISDFVKKVNILDKIDRKVDQILWQDESMVNLVRLDTPLKYTKVEKAISYACYTGLAASLVYGTYIGIQSLIK